jgi:hypothetical protein
VLPLGLVEPDGAVLGVLEVSLVPVPVLEGVLPLGVLPAALPEEVSELPGARGEVMPLPLRSRGSVSPLRPCGALVLLPGFAALGLSLQAPTATRAAVAPKVSHLRIDIRSSVSGWTLNVGSGP